MEKMKLMAAAAVAAGFLLAGCNDDSKRAELATEKQKLSYAMGLDIGNVVKNSGTDIDLDAFSQAVRDTVNGVEPQLGAEEIEKVKQAYLEKRRAEFIAGQQKLAEERAKRGEENKKKGPAFLAANKKRDGVVTTASGLQYEVLGEGSGAKPKATDTVKVHYRGTFIDGSEFDSSYGRNESATFPLDGVIAGWTEGVQLMKTGSKYRFYVPAELGYGEAGYGAKIAPYETLIFEIELLEIVKEG